MSNYKTTLQSNNIGLQEILHSINELPDAECRQSNLRAKDVNFYDYDGTLLYSYTTAEIQSIVGLPLPPKHNGLLFQEWNYDIDTIKSYNRPVNVGATYSTDDGSTRIYIHLEDGRTSPMLGVCVNGSVTVDWGDGTDCDILTGNNLLHAQFTSRHEYSAPGDYVIKLTVNGYISFYYNAHLRSMILIDNINSYESLHDVYLNAIRKVEIGNGVLKIGHGAFNMCCSLSSVVIPNSIEEIDYGAFNVCCSLSSVVIPNGISTIAGAAFSMCYSLSSVVIPNSIEEIGVGAFERCCSLSSVVIPNSIRKIYADAFERCFSLSSVVIPNSIEEIGSNVFLECQSICYYDFSNCTTIPTISTTSFNGAPGYEIRVPAALYDEWIVATNWVTYASKIKAV